MESIDKTAEKLSGDCKRCACCGEYYHVGDMAVTADGYVCTVCLDAYYALCESCGDRYHIRDLIVTAEGDDVCQACLNDYYARCESCGKYYRIRDLITTADGDDVCQDCLDGGYTCCVCCREYYRNEDLVAVTNYGDVCADCYGTDEFYECADCGRTYHVDDLGYDDDRDEWYCSDCEGRHKRIPGYHDDNTPFLPHGADGKIIDCDEWEKLRRKRLFMGTEWELAFGGESYAKFLEISQALGMPHDGGECRIERDSSLSAGAEIISMPGTLEYFTEFLKLEDGFNLARAYGYKAHDGGLCGAHIHIDRRYFEDSMFNPEYGLIILVQNNRNWLLPFSRRVNMRYCAFESEETPFSAEDFAPDNSARWSVMDRLSYLRGFYTGHGVAINFDGYSTIEIRFFRGSLKPNTIRANHQLVEMMAYAIKHFSEVQLCNIDLQWFKKFAKRKGFTHFLRYLAERDIAAS